MSDDSGLPAGFTIDSDDDTSSAPTSAQPLPKGFKVDQTFDNSPSQPVAPHPVLNAGAKVAADFMSNPGKVAIGGAENFLSGITSGAGSLADALTLSDPGTHKWTYQPRTEAGQDLAALSSAEGHEVGKAYDATFGMGPAAQTFKESIPEAAGAIGTITGAKLGLDTAGDAAGSYLLSDQGAPEGYVPSAADVVAAHTAKSPTNMGAAQTAVDTTKLSPKLQRAILGAGPNLNMDAVQRHAVIDTLPMPDGETPAPLTKGQATQDAQQQSDEINLRADGDTQGLLTNSIKNQNATLGSSMGEIRRRATAAIVQRSTPEHSQAAIDAIKTQDNAAVLDMRAKYKALADQNGGTMPIDTGQVIDQINGNLGNRFLTKTAAQDPDISEVMDTLASGKPMTFEQFENARTNLAAVQRGGGTAATAAGVVRNALENMPLSEQAQGLKNLADSARAAAKARFDTIDQNPAYKAAVEDNVPKDPNGLHVIGAPSPLADSFMNQYFLGNGANASRAYVARMQGVMSGNQDFAPAVEASSLNKLRDAAGLNEYDQGDWKHAGYTNARNALNNKADVLMSPESVANTDQLKQASGLYNHVGKEGSVNRSNTAVTLQRFGALPDTDPSLWGDLADTGSDLAAHAILPGAGGALFSVGKRIGKTVLGGKKDAAAKAALQNSKLKFAQDATAPGAGIAAPSAPVISRASGGKVTKQPTHDELVDRLFKRWTSARRDATSATKPLLHVPDAVITNALDIAQEHI